MTLLTRAIVCFSFIAVLPVAARAQDPPATAKPTGLPASVDWTFNLDAGWGSFGFANSLFDNPKEPGVDRGPQRSMVRGLRQTGVVGDLHARLVQRDIRQGERGRRAHLRFGAGSVRHGRVVVRARRPLHRLAIGKVARRSARTRWTSASDGRSTALVMGFCCSTARPRAEAAAGTGRTRARRSSSRRLAASSRALTRSRPSISTRTSSRRARAAAGCGAPTTSITIGETTTLGATYMRWFADPEFKPGRDGLNVFNIRAFTAPVANLSRSLV